MQKTIECPSCGGQQAVHNPGITMVVCEFCSSSLYWNEEAVLSAGEKAILAQGDTRLWDGAKGSLQGKPFTVIGHVRYDYGAGSWDEWYLETGGDTLWLSEDERELSLERPLEASPEDVPPAGMLSTGEPLTVGGQAYTVREVGEARCVGSWGQLPFAVLPNETYPYADIADAGGKRFGTLEYDRVGQPRIFLGEPLPHDALTVEGKPPSDPAETGAAEGGTSISCPDCGAPSDKPTGRKVDTLVCPYCGSQNDLTGAEAKAMGKNPTGLDPRFELDIAGRGTFEGAEFEIIGRMLMVDDEGFEARQYLLWNPDRDYLYLEEESGDFVLNRVTTQAPSEDPFDLDEGERVRVGSRSFEFIEDGTSTLRYVDGALPWLAAAGDKTDYADFEGSGSSVYGVERSDREIEYFDGETMDRATVRAAFGLAPPAGATPSAGAARPGTRPAAPRVARPVKKGGGCLRSCLVLGVGSIVVFVLLIILGTVALSVGLRDDGKKSYDAYLAAGGELTALGSRLTEARKSEPWIATCEPASKDWPATIENARAKLAELETTTLVELKALNDEDSFWSFSEVSPLITTLDEHREGAMAPAISAAADLDRWLAFKRELSDKVQAYEANYQAVSGVKLDKLTREVNRAKKDWPEADLGRLTGLFDEAGSAQTTARSIWDEHLAAHKLAKRGEITVAVCQTLPEGWRTMAGFGDAVQRANTQIPSQILQLYTAWEKLLIDMEIKEGMEVSFAHQYRTVLVSVAPGKKAEAPVVNDNWESVNKSVYNASEGYLGMAVAHKSLGKFDDESINEVTPAGYSLLPPPGTNKNRFGKWQGGSGDGATWTWLPAYAALGTILWATHHKPTRGNAASYYGSRKSNRVFYGGGAVLLFGNTGSFTRSRYGSSKYYQNNMFKNTQYISSGRTYRGRRYTSSYRSSSSSGSRFGGGK